MSIKDALKEDGNYLFELKDDSYQFVDNLDTFCFVVSSILSDQKALGVDIECTNKSYHGYICLLQISYKAENDTIKTFIIDTLSIFAGVESDVKKDICQDFLGQMIFENPNIVKIFHGGINSNGDIGLL